MEKIKLRTDLLSTDEQIDKEKNNKTTFSYQWMAVHPQHNGEKWLWQELQGLTTGVCVCSYSGLRSSWFWVLVAVNATPFCPRGSACPSCPVHECPQTRWTSTRKHAQTDTQTRTHNVVSDSLMLYKVIKRVFFHISCDKSKKNNFICLTMVIKILYLNVVILFMLLR